ncbi:MAG: UDP-3-O-(3-hydroxymyristoyl)glucosamine N-acyltransferase [Gemmatimonadota bacterium]|nr:UDP-3-O-(3-hydroxymyristoyl)glucosamine N-acyltransferase [Gemmatimonadota bacterium]MDE2985201.1 UDP-3-O-(3-hydroxymyristoyl)glucosamine N-acyltransferase [Gemmatimonadota bacterium]
MTLAEAAEATGGRVLGDTSVTFERISPVHDAGPRDLAMLVDRRYATDLPGCGGRALLVSEALCGIEDGPADRVVVADPHAALADLLPLLHPDPPRDRGVHSSAVVDPSVVVPGRASVGPHAVVCSGVTLGEGVRIGANCFVGEGVAIGAETVLYPNCTLYAGSVLGDRVVVHAGSSIGVDGFGYVTSGGEHRKVPQVGGCVVEDDVEIGANCAIDRGSIGRTVIGAGSKLDNLVHIGHNVTIGPRSMLVAQVGVAGSTRTGAGVGMGGQAGISGHLRIGARAQIAAQAGVIGDVGPGQVVSGYPARDHRTYLRAMASLMKLPELVRRMGRLERRLDGRDGA